jgi:TIR domain
MEDEPTAHILAGPLQRAEFSVWRDRHIPPGKTWNDAIGRAPEDAACVLVLWSKVSVES